MSMLPGLFTSSPYNTLFMRIRLLSARLLRTFIFSARLLSTFTFIHSPSSKIIILWYCNNAIGYIQSSCKYIFYPQIVNLYISHENISCNFFNLWYKGIIFKYNNEIADSLFMSWVDCVRCLKLSLFTVVYVLFIIILWLY